MTGSERTRTLATTWATSVEKLSPESRRLLDWIAMLSAHPIPDSLIGVAVPGEAAGLLRMLGRVFRRTARDRSAASAGATSARAGLYAYSLITRATGEDGQGFVVHRLVQDFARRAMTEERRDEALREALGWVNAAFVGDPQDVRSWPVLDPLAPHALAVARRADEAGIAEPTAWLINQLALLSYAKARYAEAEPLYRRALAIREKTLGADHPQVATGLNNLASLLDATNRRAEAEPLHRRALAIWEKSLGPDHPQVATGLNNLAGLLKDTNRRGEAEALMRRALAIDEKSLGSDHPDVAHRLNNLAELLRATNRLAEAEPLYRRALTILEKSLGPDHPNVATALNNLAVLLKDTNRRGEAEPLMRRALAIYEKSLGADHPSTVNARGNLGALEAERNRRT